MKTFVFTFAAAVLMFAVLISTSRTLAADHACSAVFSVRAEPFFAVADFPPQRGMPVETRNDSRYAAWAAKSANEVLQQIETQSVRFIFDLIAKSRRRLQFEIEKEISPITSLFGKERTPETSKKMPPDGEWGISWWTSNGYYSLNPNKEPDGFSRLILKTYRELRERKIDGLDGSIYSTYRLRNGEFLILSTFMRMDSEKMFYVKHPSDQASRLIAEDAESIFQDLIDKSKKGQPATAHDEDQFFHATRGWLGAIKYYRGSAAIGRSVIAALYAEIFGAKLITPKDPYNLDIIAIIQSEQDFTTQMKNLNPPTAN